MRTQDCFPVLAFDLIRECYVEATTSECFSTSGNAVVTSQEHAARTEVAYNLLDDMNGFAAFPSFARDSLPAYTLPPPQWAQ